MAVVKCIFNREHILCQGDILLDVEFVEYAKDIGDDLVEISRITFPFATVISQSCDIEQTNNIINDPPNSSRLFNVIVIPMHNAASLRSGKHLSEIGINSTGINSDRWRDICNNSVNRYHYSNIEPLEEIPNIGIYEFVMDFKHYFSLNFNDAVALRSNTNHYWCTIKTPYIEHLSQRFSHYFERIGLPGPENQRV